MGNWLQRDSLGGIDMAHELKSYETDKTELVEKTVWQRAVVGDFGFNAETHYPETMLVLDLGMRRCLSGGCGLRTSCGGRVRGAPEFAGEVQQGVERAKAGLFSAGPFF